MWTKRNQFGCCEREKMKNINAFWEKRNMGVESVEIEVENTDTVEELKEAVEKVNAEYIVLKIPAGKIDCMFMAEECGFHFIESIIHVTRDLKNLELSGIQKRINDSVTYEKMNENDMEVLFKEIRDGLFQTDRVFLDPKFTEAQSANRYIGWISDELERGCEIYKLIYKKQAVGFFTLKETEPGIFYPFLAGIYKAYQTGSLGAVFNYKPMFEAKRRNGRMISTYISTNNSNTVRMHAMYGFQFREIYYVYVKHIK